MGESMFARLLEDLRSAEHFIFMEYFIIEEGHFWNSILEILKEKAAAGVEVKVVKFGHWKDVGLRLEGDAVKELTNLFLIDYGINVRKKPEQKYYYFPKYSLPEAGYLVPFGDGPAPICNRRVGKSVIQNMLNQADRYVYIMSPYLIIDNELCQAIEDTALRGVTVRLNLPHIPDKKIILEMARSYYHRLIRAGVEVYEYEPGFVHAKVYLADDEYGMVGTINLDYRSLVHHFENGVWMYRCELHSLSFDSLIFILPGA